MVSDPKNTNFMKFTIDSVLILVVMEYGLRLNIDKAFVEKYGSES